MLKNYLIWAAALLLSALSGATVLGSIAKYRAPELAASVFPVNGFALERMAAEPAKARLVENNGQFPNEISKSEKATAKQAFIAEPLALQAIAVLALDNQETRKRELMEAAFALSRREQFVTSWMVVDSGEREDLSAVLHYYDIILRTSASAAPAVIPILSSVLADDNFVGPFADLMKRKPPWGGQFWTSVVSMPNSLTNAARLREMLFNSKERSDFYRDSYLILALVNNKQFEQARSLHGLLAGQKNNSRIMGQAAFDGEPKYPPIDWQLFSTGEYGAVITDGKLVLDGINKSEGLFARQLVKLPEKAALELTLDKVVPDDARVFINLSCAESIDNMPQKIRIPLKEKALNRRINNFQTECSFYWLEVVGSVSEAADGFEITIDSVRVK